MANIEVLRESLNCSICCDLVTLPVHPICCDKSQSMSAACLSCVREYLELNKSNHERIKMRKSWNGCGCNIIIQSKSSHHLYRHTLQLDQIRNLFGPSKCHHEECGIEFETAAELRRHLTGNSKSHDKHGNCQYAMTQCKHCRYFNKRHIVEGEHFKKFHSFTLCDVCCQNVNNNDLNYHYENHLEKIKLLYEKMLKFRQDK